MSRHCSFLHRWIENVPVAERAVQVWPMVVMYVDAVKQKKLPNPSTASYDTTEAAQADPLMIAKLQFFLAISRTFSLFLTNYQTDEPVLPFFAKDLSELLKVIITIGPNSTIYPWMCGGPQLCKINAMCAVLHRLLHRTHLR